jgi:hypothetical protein
MEMGKRITSSSSSRKEGKKGRRKPKKWDRKPQEIGLAI